MTATTPTIERFAQAAFDGIDLESVIDGDNRDEFLRTAVDGEVTAMTSDLFALVVNDNALAFLDYEGDDSPDPFNCLRHAIFDAVLERLTELVNEAASADSEDD